LTISADRDILWMFNFVDYLEMRCLSCAPLPPPRTI